MWLDVILVIHSVLLCFRFNYGQCGKDHVLSDEDVVQIVKKI